MESPRLRVLVAILAGAAAAPHADAAATSAPPAPTASAPAAAPGPAVTRDVTWGEIHEAAARVICVVTSTSKFGEEFHDAVAGDRARCGAPPAETVADRAVDAALAGAGALPGLLEPDLSAAIAPGLAPAERSRRAAEAYLASTPFRRMLVPRVQAALALENARCTDCPAFEPRARRTVTFKQLAPYGAAGGSPDDPRPRRAPPGPPPAAPHAGLYVCATRNGLGGMKSPDLELARAAYLATCGNEPFRALATRHFEAALAAPEYQALESDAARTVYLRRHVPAATVADPDARALVCPRLAAAADDVALAVKDCR